MQPPTSKASADPWRSNRLTTRWCKLALLLPLSAGADPILVGLGLVSTTGTDSGERLNVTGTPNTLASGTWQVGNFIFHGTSATGTVTPFLGVANGTDSYEAIWVGSPVASVNGRAAFSPEGTFTLPASADVYAGFYSEGGGRIAFATSGNTDHDNAFATPTQGGTVDGFSNANLARNYSFHLALSAASPVIQLGSGPQWTTGVDSGDRLNVDQAYGRQLSAGQYSIQGFSFFGTADTGTVTPFLALSTGPNAYDIAWVGDPVNSQNGLVSSNPNQVLNVAAPGRYLPGFFTTGGRVAFSPTSNTDPFAITDHAGAFTPPTQGSNYNVFSNPDLARRYAFDLSLVAVPEPSAATLFGLGLGLLTWRRFRRAS